ncbi:MAG: hypothetical protein P0S94_03955 [Simkaniaceae bacterium]|nr:hypothetical protein [Simkaniaceae bacterium]
MSSIEFHVENSVIPYTIGVAGGCFLMGTMGYITDFFLNIKHGDYSNLRKLQDGRVIVSMPVDEKSHIQRNIIITCFFEALTLTLAKSTPFLDAIKSPKDFMKYNTLLFGMTTAPAFYSMFYYYTTRSGDHGKTWAIVPPQILRHRQITVEQVRPLESPARVYETLSFPPEKLS